MIKEALKYLLELKRPETIQVDGRDYSTIDIKPIKEAQCAPLNVYNLESLINYLKANPDKLNSQKILNIVNPTKVVVESALFGKFKQRETYIEADYSNLVPEIYFGRFLDMEEFMIMLKSKFFETEKLNNIISIVGNVQNEAVTHYNDDGFSQEVVVRTGVVRVGNVPVPPRVKLIPYRTFIEVPQPASEFILRARKCSYGVEFALFEADGGVWKKDAIKYISTYLKDHLKEVENITILS